MTSDDEEALLSAPVTVNPGALVLAAEGDSEPTDEEALADLIRARPHRGLNKKRYNTDPTRRKLARPQPAEVIAEVEEAGLEDDEFHRDDEEEQQHEAEVDTNFGELLLGKYPVQWRDEGVTACQRRQGKWAEEDPKIRWERVYAVQPLLESTEFLKWFCALFPIVILKWWCQDITVKGRRKYDNRFITQNRDFTPGLFFVVLACFFYMSMHPGLPREEYFQKVAEFPKVAHNLERFGLPYHDLKHILEFLELPQYSSAAPPPPQAQSSRRLPQLFL
ncbi:hypothetical protein CYMTET_24011 [Cymbomonas tetramitiformis]|uniref:Uncharacterized protein n=1 Tax=Cymbomonas tetramitiformis TaxID=36881 RepID=A0AAE0FWZ7_9CHLO|nr:hypothetical protein CYMTET_24011 [Cymbomonas tetramitiformis]